jgi:adenine-specific DNA-methyltransferase
MGKIDEALSILKALGLPKAQQNERSALTLLALVDLKKNSPWPKAKSRLIRIHDILIFIQENYGKQYAENTRETIRRQTLHQFEQAALVVRNPDDPSRPTNSPNNVYTVAVEALEVIRKYRTKGWTRKLEEFLKLKGTLIDLYDRRKRVLYTSVKLPYGTSIDFTPGKHNKLQITVLKLFRAQFCPNSKIVYVGDAARKLLHKDETILKKLNIPITEHDKLPDVVLYDGSKKLLFLIEAVTSHGPLSPKRQIELEKVLAGCRVRKVYISAFPDFLEFKRHIDNIAWETEVWIEANPAHMIHFNGPKFFTVYE